MVKRVVVAGVVPVASAEGDGRDRGDQDEQQFLFHTEPAYETAAGSVT